MNKHYHEKLRSICLDLPEASEVVMKRGPTYRVRNKIFALERVVSDRLSLWFKPHYTYPGIGVPIDGHVLFVPPYYGSKGWLGTWLDDATEWGQIDWLVRHSYRMIAPRQLGAQIAL